MKALRYFVRPLGGVAANRYFVLDARHGDTVVRVQLSKPDGEQVPPPAGVRWRPVTLTDSLKPMARHGSHRHGVNQPVSAIEHRQCPACRTTRPLAQFRALDGRLRLTCSACADASRFTRRRKGAA